MTSSRFLDDCIQRNQEFLERALRAVAELPEDKLNRKTVNGEWSPAQIFKHMLLGNAPYEILVSEALKTLPKDPSNAEVKNTLFGKNLTKFAGPAGNVPAPKQFTPADEPLSKGVIQEWANQQTLLVELMQSARGKDLNKKCFRNPMMKLFGMNLCDAFSLLTSHTERHVLQIEERAAGSC